MMQFLVLIAFTLSTQAFALPLPKQNYLAQSTNTGSLFQDQGYNFEGIIALSNCSGSLIRFTKSKLDDKAVVLTNGHCLANSFGGGMPSPGEVIVNRDVNRTLYVLKATDGSKIGSVQAEKILYATMTKTDITLYRLKQTYRDIETKFRTRALTLSERDVTVGEPIEIISGYWRRGYSCKTEAIISTLHEAGWVMNDSIRYSRPGCETIGGTSGSPITSTLTREVIGINNTGNEDGQMCTMNNPCEVDENGHTTATKGYSYGQQTTWIYSCLNEKLELDLTIAGCKLAH